MTKKRSTQKWNQLLADFQQEWHNWELRHGDEEATLLKMAAAHFFWSIDLAIDEILLFDSPAAANKKFDSLNRSARYGGDRKIEKKLDANLVIPTVRDTKSKILEWCIKHLNRNDGANTLLRRHADPHHTCTLPDYFPYAFLAQLPESKSKSMEGLLHLIVQASSCKVAGRIALIARAPVEVHIDARGRFHRDDGPAILFPDGTSIYMVAGIVMRPDYFSPHPKIDPVNIINQTNQEVRRVLLERLGIDRFLQESKAREVAVDDFGTLYHADDPNAYPGMDFPPIVLVKLLNSTPEPGTSDHFKEYLLRVPPEIETPRQAVAWSFGLQEENYAPAEET